MKDFAIIAAFIVAVGGAIALVTYGLNKQATERDRQDRFDLICHYEQGQPQGKVCVKDNRVVLRYQDVAKLIESE